MAVAAKRYLRLASHVWVWLAIWHVLARDGNAASVNATVSRTIITLGQTLTLTISVEGAQAQPPGLPAIPGIQVVSQGTSVQIINNAVQHAFTFELAPTQAGDMVIPGIPVNLGAQVAMTRPIQIKVLPPGAAAGGAPPPAFARIVLPKTNLYVGEVLDMDIQVFMQEGRLTQYPQLPADSGFTIGKWLKPTEARVAVSNATYTLITFRTPITAVKAGALTVGPATQSIIVPDRSRPPGFFFRNEREIRAIGELVTAVALPLPSNNVPSTFAGAVGQYSISWSAAPTTVAVGDPVTVRIQVAGRGWLDALKLPQQPQWRDFKMYEPNTKIEGSDPNNVSGARTFELAVVPQSADVKALPSFAFTYFDPQTAQYRTAATQPIPLTVKPGAASAVALPPLTATNATEAAPMSDIAHIKLRLGSVTAPLPLLVRPWFIALQVLAPALCFAMFVQRRRADALANDPRKRRRRETFALVQETLQRMRENADAHDSNAFFSNAVRALKEQIGERLDIPAASVTEAIVSERLRPAGFPEESCRSLEDLFHAANLARYAPVKSTAELNEQLARTERVLGELQAWEVKL